MSERTLYTPFRKYCTTRFGGPVYKISLNGGFSCPNRRAGSPGCLFCDNRSFSPAATTRENVTDQLSRAITRLSPRFTRFIGYLQPFTNTYAPLDQLTTVYESIVNHPGIVGLAIGTRPDCFTEHLYDYLAQLATQTFLIIEVGVQSSHPETLNRINRGHSWEDVIVCIRELARRNIYTVAHCMLGLPGETVTHTNITASRLAALPVRGIKLHQLMVIRDTPLERLYNGKVYRPLSLAAYSEMAGQFIARLHPDMHLHRLMADSTINNGLIAPAWSACKSESIQYIRAHLAANNLFQGSKFTKE